MSHVLLRPRCLGSSSLSNCCVGLLPLLHLGSLLPNRFMASSFPSVHCKSPHLSPFQVQPLCYLFLLDDPLSSSPIEGQSFPPCIQRRSQDFCLGGATRPMSPGRFSVISRTVEPTRFRGGGVVAEIFRDLRSRPDSVGGGGSSINFP